MSNLETLCWVVFIVVSWCNLGFAYARYRHLCPATKWRIRLAYALHGVGSLAAGTLPLIWHAWPVTRGLPMHWLPLLVPSTGLLLMAVTYPYGLNGRVPGYWKTDYVPKRRKDDAK